MKYAIFAGLSGGFGGATFQYVDNFDSEYEALDAAYDKAVEEYESYEGCHGLMDWEDVRNDLRESFGEEPGEEDVRERYIEEVESWIDYRVEEDEEGEDYE